MTEQNRLLDQFQREVSGEPWHGPSLANILDGLTAEQAARKPPDGAHSIWEILLHMTGWKREVTRRARGMKADVPSQGDWPAVGPVTDERWQAARADHFDAQRELLDVIRTLSGAQLEAMVEGDSAAYSGAGVPVAVNLYGLLQHDAYHSGQIALLKKMGGGTIRYGL